MFKTFYLIFKFRSRNPQTCVTPALVLDMPAASFQSARAREDEQNVKIQILKSI